MVVQSIFILPNIFFIYIIYTENKFSFLLNSENTSYQLFKLYQKKLIFIYKSIWRVYFQPTTTQLTHSVLCLVPVVSARISALMLPQGRMVFANAGVLLILSASAAVNTVIPYLAAHMVLVRTRVRTWRGLLRRRCAFNLFARIHQGLLLPVMVWLVVQAVS